MSFSFASEVSGEQQLSMLEILTYDQKMGYFSNTESEIKFDYVIRNGLEFYEVILILILKPRILDSTPLISPDFGC